MEKEGKKYNTKWFIPNKSFFSFKKEVILYNSDVKIKDIMPLIKRVNTFIGHHSYLLYPLRYETYTRNNNILEENNIYDEDDFTEYVSTNKKLTKQEFKKFKKCTCDKNENCSICLGKLNKYNIKIKCGHIFHKNCIRKWLLYVNCTCPLCRMKQN